MITGKLLTALFAVATSINSVDAKCVQKILWSGQKGPCEEVPDPVYEWWTTVWWWPLATTRYHFLRYCGDDDTKFKCGFREGDGALMCIDLEHNVPCGKSQPSEHDWWAYDDPNWPDAFEYADSLRPCNPRPDCINNRCIDDEKTPCTEYGDHPREVDEPKKETPLQTVPNGTNRDSYPPGIYYTIGGKLADVGAMPPADMIERLGKEWCTSMSNCPRGGMEGDTHCVDSHVDTWDKEIPWKICLKTSGFFNNYGNDDSFQIEEIRQAFWDAMRDVTREATLTLDVPVQDDINSYGLPVYHNETNYAIPSLLEMVVVTNNGTSIYAIVNFHAYRVIPGCHALDKAKNIAAGIGTAGKAAGMVWPPAKALGFLSLPIQFISFMKGCESLKPPGWEIDRGAEYDLLEAR